MNGNHTGAMTIFFLRNTWQGLLSPLGKSARLAIAGDVLEKLGESLGELGLAEPGARLSALGDDFRREAAQMLGPRVI